MADAKPHRPQHPRTPRNHKRLHRSRNQCPMARRKTKTTPRRPTQSENHLEIFVSAFLSREGFGRSPVISRERLGEGSADQRDHKESSFFIFCVIRLCVILKRSEESRILNARLRALILISPKLFTVDA